MGLLRRLFGGSGGDAAPQAQRQAAPAPKEAESAPPPPPPSPSPRPPKVKGKRPPYDPAPVGRRLRLSCSGRVHVVGESHYQPALRQAAGGRESADLDDAIPVEAVLVPEPSNPHDSTAVRVDVAGQTVGYLSREVAVQYHRPLRAVVDAGRAPYCTAQITGGGERHYGVFLHLGGPDIVVIPNEVEGAHFVEGDWMITVAKRQQHQDVLQRFADSYGLPTGAWVTLHPAKIASGKWAGDDTVEVRLDGERVGELTKKMADKYLPILRPLFDAGETPACEAFVHEEPKGLSISLRLPQA